MEAQALDVDQRRFEIVHRWQNGASLSEIAGDLGLADGRVYQLCVSTLDILAEPGVLRNPLDRVVDNDLLP